MSLKTINTIIPMLSLLIFFIWGWIEGSYQHSWIIFMVGGMAMVVVRMIYNDKQNKNGADKKDGENS